MSNDFIDHIEIKHFKCFRDFKAEGFKRINLIGGQNNVGKTAFMEACFLSRANSTTELYKKILEIQSHRNIINTLLSNTSRQQDIQQLIANSIPLSIYIDNSHDTEDTYSLVFTKRNEYDGNFVVNTHLISDGKKIGRSEKYSYSELINVIDISLKNTKYHYSFNFISPCSNSDKELIDIVGQFKLDNKYEAINQYLKDIFEISVIDIIKNKPMLKADGKYYDLSNFGQGIKSFINIIGSMLLLENDIIFIDELENGIHYQHFDQLWEIILTISKQQNIQVFATTHSKECLESYGKVAHQQQEDDIAFITLLKNRQNQLQAITYSDKTFANSLMQHHEVRGS